MNRIPNDVVYLIYKYLHHHNFNIVLSELKEATSDCCGESALYIKRCRSCNKQWLYTSQDCGEFTMCRSCYDIWLADMDSSYE